MAFIAKKSLNNLQSNITIDDNSIRKRNSEWVVIIDEENAIVDNNNLSSTIKEEQEEPEIKEIYRRYPSPRYNLESTEFEDSVCNFINNIDFDKVLECFLIPINNLVIYLQQNIEIYETNNQLEIV